MSLDAFAKVNLSLQVRGPDASGMHQLRSLVTSIDWHDRVVVGDGDEDRIDVSGASDVPADDTNLAWRAAAAVRQDAGGRGPMALYLEKRIPAAAGLGGGSADAAAALVLAARRFGLDDARRDALAPDLGADVPFCLSGGAAWMEGVGDRLTLLPPFRGFALAVVVPPFPLATAEVYHRWDALDGPSGPVVGGRDLPVTLRGFGPLRNDLYPAAVDMAPGLGDRVAGLRRRWGVPVSMSGSGPSLYGFFPTVDEAAGAVAAVTDARGACACLSVARGWRETPAGTLP